jgi:hypothetical protein
VKAEQALEEARAGQVAAVAQAREEERLAHQAALKVCRNSRNSVAIVCISVTPKEKHTKGLVLVRTSN